MLKDQLLALSLIPSLHMAIPQAAPIEAVVQAPVAKVGTALPATQRVPKPAFIESVAGAGPALAPGDLAECHLLLRDTAGKTLIDTRLNGQTFTLLARDGDDLINSLIHGMKAGATRRIAFAAKDINGGNGLPPFVPAKVNGEVTVQMLRIIKQ